MPTNLWAHNSPPNQFLTPTAGDFDDDNDDNDGGDDEDDIFICIIKYKSLYFIYTTRII